MTNLVTLVNFEKATHLDDWYVVNDTVMGGRSSAKFELKDNQYASFYGEVSTANNGGFASVRRNFDQMNIKDCSIAVLQVKGDGKSYQLRFKKNSDDYYSYLYEFETTGEWQEINIPLNEMYASWRGRKVDLENFHANQIEELAFLIGNKRNEIFKLDIKSIQVK
ncbi:MAG: CIA30 family protein [Nonlabens sp.]